jgi:hypothetical protein
VANPLRDCPNAVDVRLFRDADPGARRGHPLAGHTGLHGQLQWELLHHDDMRLVFKAILARVRRGADRVVVFCKSGRHRSVAIVELLRWSRVLESWVLLELDGVEPAVTYRHADRDGWRCNGPGCAQCRQSVPEGGWDLLYEDCCNLWLECQDE